MLTGMETVGDRIKRLRLAVQPRLTQAALAKAIGCTRSAIAQVEGGMSNSLNAENIAKAAQYFGRNSVWLATGEGPEYPSDAVSEALEALPVEGRQQTLDFIFYQIERAKDVFTDRPGGYTRMIERITKDMQRRKSADESAVPPASRIDDAEAADAPDPTKKLI